MYLYLCEIFNTVINNPKTNLSFLKKKKTTKIPQFETVYSTVPILWCLLWSRDCAHVLVSRDKRSNKLGHCGSRSVDLVISRGSNVNVSYVATSS